MIASIIASVLEWFLQKIFALIGKDLDLWRQEQTNKDQAAQDAQKLKDAKSDQDKADAARGIADHTF